MTSYALNPNPQNVLDQFPQVQEPCEYTKRSHVNFCVYDSTCEAADAFQLDHNGNVDAWAKNDYLGFEVLYVYKSVVQQITA